MSPTLRTLLVVDDDVDFCKLLRDVFGELGYWVVTVTNTEAANRFLTKQLPDVAVIDLWLPERNGLTAIHAIKQHAGPATPVVVVAPTAEDTNWKEVFALGTDRAIIMPYEIDDLVEAVTELCPLPMVLPSQE